MNDDEKVKTEAEYRAAAFKRLSDLASGKTREVDYHDSQVQVGACEAILRHTSPTTG